MNKRSAREYCLRALFLPFITPSLITSTHTSYTVLMHIGCATCGISKRFVILAHAEPQQLHLNAPFCRWATIELMQTMQFGLPLPVSDADIALRTPSDWPSLSFCLKTDQIHKSRPLGFAPRRKHVNILTTIEKQREPATLTSTCNPHMSTQHGASFKTMRTRKARLLQQREATDAPNIPEGWQPADVRFTTINLLHE